MEILLGHQVMGLVNELKVTGWIHNLVSLRLLALRDSKSDINNVDFEESLPTAGDRNRAGQGRAGQGKA